MRFCVLGSSSSGNAAFVESGGCKVLIDAGFSLRELTRRLEEIREHPQHLEAVFITHEHGDHTQGLQSLLKRYPKLQVFANAATAEALSRKCPQGPNWKLFETGNKFPYKNFEVRSFALPHDAQDPVGFTFTVHEPQTRSLGWVTDLGYVPDGLDKELAACELIVLEANHDAELLQNDPQRPRSLKQRISGRHGHLSNDAAYSFIKNMVPASWRYLCLAHLSSQCNATERVAARFSELQSPHRSIEVIASNARACLYDLNCP